MPFVKSQKSRAYFKRFQVKYKRRREGKTDYRARIRLINQDKNKYNTPKYRFVVRFTNKDIVAQIVSASIAGDLVLAAAYAHELPHYGLEVGLTNYAAAYCTGLLLARRVLKKLEMDDEYEGNVEGALDGGLDIPHGEKRFAGFSKDSKQLDAEVHRKYIYGGHVAAYMTTLADDEPEKFQSHFSEYIKKGIEADNIEELYKKVHAAIRADPTIKKTEKPAPQEHKRYNLKKLTFDERKKKLVERLKAFNEAVESIVTQMKFTFLLTKQRKGRDGVDERQQISHPIEIFPTSSLLTTRVQHILRVTEIMAHPLASPPPTTAAAATISTAASNKTTRYRSVGFRNVSASHQASNDPHAANNNLVNRRTVGLGLAAAALSFNVSNPNSSANAAARRPPPPPVEEKEKKDPNVSGVIAKVLASKKRKEAMKQSVAKLRDKGKPIQEPSE
ncbi:hypothetical protein C1H46_034249 [Malus baccata]|uniref:Large ribosomal subunit protein uL18 C-terminal eukaryotes domain-containing protein n=1 Tax=Malus baccata TaxID=106549 RepID=A0A540L175_MALBA|nr:hypothetical protein C1H46_034249 [Malus baccata]